MTLKTKIEKLENQFGCDDSPVCTCRNNFENTRIYIQDLTIESADSGKRLSNLPSDTCDRCSRPVEYSDLTIQIIDSSTNERFPGIWKKKRE